MFVEYGSLDRQTFFTALFAFIARSGNEAVMVFFVLSGFLVGGMAVERVRQHRFDLRGYAIDRFARIYMPLIPSLVVTVLVGLYLGSPDWWTALGNLLALQGAFVEPLQPNPPLWSLSYEIWFYVIAGSTAALFTRRSITAALVLLLGLSMFLFLDPLYLIVWLIGTAAYYLRPTVKPRLQLAAAAVSVGIGAILSQLTRASVSVEVVMPMSHSVAVIILALAVAWFVACLRMYEAPRYWAICGEKLAAPSYTLYLTHYPLLALLGLQPGQISSFRMGVYLSVVALCVAFAFAFYFAFERNTPAVKRWLRRRIDRGDARREAIPSI